MISPRAWVFSILTALAATPAAEAQKAVYLVRHAEKAGDDAMSPLTAAGTARAEELARLLAKSGAKAIYTSEFRRTKDTAAPLAAKLGLTPIEKPAADPNATFNDVISHHADEVVVVVGHTTTLPALLKKWNSAADVTIPESEFDNVFIVVPLAPGPAGWSRFRYAVPPSP